MKARAWFLLGACLGGLAVLFCGPPSPESIAAAQQNDAAAQPKVLYGRTVLDFGRGDTYVRKTVELPPNCFADQPAIVVSESGSAGTWIVVKAEDIQQNSFAVAGLRYAAGSNKPYHAQIAWVAVGKAP